LKVFVIVWPDFAFMFVYCYAVTDMFMSSCSVAKKRTGNPSDKFTPTDVTHRRLHTPTVALE